MYQRLKTKRKWSSLHDISAKFGEILRENPFPEGKSLFASVQKDIAHFNLTMSPSTNIVWRPTSFWVTMLSSSKITMMMKITMMSTLMAMIIHPKRWFPRLQKSADNFEFSAERFLRTRKVSRLHCLQSYWLPFPLFMFSHCLTCQ